MKNEKEMAILNYIKMCCIPDASRKYRINK